MTQDIPTLTDAHLPDALSPSADSSHASAGALLRAYREAQGLKIDNLASALKVPVSKLASLEHDRLDELPDAMFARALALAMCRLLKADAAPVLAMLPGQDVSRLAPKDERGIDFPLQRPSFLPQSKMLTTASLLTPMRGGAVLALLVALLLAFWPDLQSFMPTKAVVVTPAQSLPVPNVAEPVIVPTPPVVAEPPAVNMVITPVQSMAVPAQQPSQIPNNSASGVVNVR